MDDGTVKFAPVHLPFPALRPLGAVVQSFHAGYEHTPLYSAAPQRTIPFTVRPLVRGALVAITRTPQGFYCQDEDRILSVFHDEQGFAGWVHTVLSDYVLTEIPLGTVVYGVWGSPDLPRGTFTVLGLGHVLAQHDPCGAFWTLDPTLIHPTLGHFASAPGVAVLEETVTYVQINPLDPLSVEDSEAHMQKFVRQWATEDSRLKRMYGVSVPCAGFIVNLGGMVTQADLANTTWYADTRILPESATTAEPTEAAAEAMQAAAALAITQPSPVHVFTLMHLTPDRMQLGVRASCGANYHRTYMPEFLAWVQSSCQHALGGPSAELLEAPSWDAVREYAVQHARTWYLGEIESREQA